MTACPTIPISRGAYYSGTKLPGCTIVFTGAGSYDTDSYFGINTLRWKWDFDYNGTFTIDVNTTSAYPTWTYSQAGTYTVAVQFIDDDGQCGAIYTFQITISGLKRLYYVKDHLGSIRVTVDSTGNIVSYDDYDPWGMQLEGRSANYGSANEKYKFTGKERDVETGYDYFGARYYDSRIGRWMSVDPLAEKYPGLSPYQYSANNPIIFLDPNGKEIWHHNSIYHSTNINRAIEIAGSTQIGHELYIDLHNNEDVFVPLFYGSPSGAAGQVISGRNEYQQWETGLRFQDVALPNRNMRVIYKVGGELEHYSSADGKRLFPIVFDEIKFNKSGLAFAVATFIHELQHVKLKLAGVPDKEHHKKMGHVVKGEQSRFDLGTGWTANMWKQVQEAVNTYQTENDPFRSYDASNGTPPR
jgi:RHS repeat-associated protein